MQRIIPGWTHITAAWEATRRRGKAALAPLLCGLLLSGCGFGVEEPPTFSDFIPRIDLGLPLSLTGASGGDSGKENCAFAALNEAGHYRDSYRLSRYLGSLTATWTCAVDGLGSGVSLMYSQGTLSTDGSFTWLTQPTPDSPRGFRADEDPVTGQRTLRFYYYNHTTPGLYVSLQTVGGVTNGRAIVDMPKVMGGPPDPAAVPPTNLRMDFMLWQGGKTADIYGAFNPTNLPGWDAPHLEGIHMKWGKNHSTGEVVLQGLFALKKQPLFDAYAGPHTPPPPQKLFAHAAGNGAGVSRALIQRLAMVLDDPAAGFNLGAYVFDKTDTFYFNADPAGVADWLERAVGAAEYDSLNDTAGTPYESELETRIGQQDAVQTCVGAGGPDPACVSLLNAIFAQGALPGIDPNTPGAPLPDGRPQALSNAKYLDTLYPPLKNDWAGVFDQNYTP